MKCASHRHIKYKKKVDILGEVMKRVWKAFHVRHLYWEIDTRGGRGVGGDSDT